MCCSNQRRYDPNSGIKVFDLVDRVLGHLQSRSRLVSVVELVDYKWWIWEQSWNVIGNFKIKAKLVDEMWRGALLISSLLLITVLNALQMSLIESIGSQVPILH